ncbi:MAG: twin-arginine translocase TatA/TatE family subunit [Rikenellaceae bacterium]
MNMLFIGGIGSTELILIVIVMLLVFGGTKLPELMRGAGRGIREFKDAVNGVEDDKKSDSAKSETTQEKKEESK